MSFTGKKLPVNHIKIVQTNRRIRCHKRRTQRRSGNPRSKQ